MQILGISATALRGRVAQRNDAEEPSTRSPVFSFSSPCLGLHGQLPHFQMEDVGLHFRTSLVLTS